MRGDAMQATKSKKGEKLVQKGLDREKGGGMIHPRAWGQSSATRGTLRDKRRVR
jgi:hypothetical protein